MSVPKKNGRMSYVDAGGELRRYTGVALIFFGVGPLMMFTLLAAKIGKPDFPLVPVLVAAPFIIVGVVVTALGIFAGDPKRSFRGVAAGAVLIILGDLLIFGLRAVLV